MPESTRRTGPELIGILLIALGAVFLLSNAGIFRWGTLWPLLLVAVGVVVVYGAVRGPAGGGRRRLAIPADGIERLDLDLRLGAGRLRLGPGSEPGTLVLVESTADDVDADVRRDGDLARVRLSRDASWWVGGWTRGAGEWRVGIAEDTRVRIGLGAGAGDFAIDLLGLRVVDASLSIGAAQLRLRLPRPVGELRIRITVGASSVSLEIPDGVEARVTTSGGLLSVEGPVETPGFATATERVLVEIDGGASSVRVRRSSS